MRQLFKSFPLAHDVLREDALPLEARAYARDTITLGWDDRLKGRGRRQSDGGHEFGTALARGVALHGGDCFVLAELDLVVVVVERAEPVLVITPTTSQEWGLFAYQIGNSHQPMMIAADAIVCADLMGMAQVLEQHAIPFTRDTRPFTPVGFVADHRHAG